MNQNIGIGATFNGKHTWRDFGLVIGNTDIVGLPKPKMFLVEIPGTSKRLDLSESLTGRMEYEGRELTFTLGGVDLPSIWHHRLSAFLAFVHGRRVQVILDDDPAYYYIGRASVEGFARTRALGEMKLKVDCEPYKYEVISSAEPWRWDCFNFETGVIRDYADLPISGSKQMKIDGSTIPVVPSFLVSNLTATDTTPRVYSYGYRKSWTLGEGKNRFAELTIPPEGDTLIFYGSYTVTIDFRGGAL